MWQYIYVEVCYSGIQVVIMHILTKNLVTYCNLMRQNAGETEYLPGVSYQNKLYVKNKFFTLEQRQEALTYTKQKFLEVTNKIICYLLVEDRTGLTIWQEDSEATIVKEETVETDPIKEKEETVEIDPIKEIDLETLVSQMRSVGGIKIKDRRYKLKVYSQCFIGSDAVQWIVENLKLPSEQAVRLGQRLIDEKWIHHVVDRQPFQDGFFFYRFYWDET